MLTYNCVEGHIYECEWLNIYVCVWALDPTATRADLEERHSSQWGKGTMQRHKALSEKILLLSEIAVMKLLTPELYVVFHSICNLSHSMAQCAHTLPPWCSIFMQATTGSVNLLAGSHWVTLLQEQGPLKFITFMWSSVGCCVYASSADCEMDQSAVLSSK